MSPLSLFGHLVDEVKSIVESFCAVTFSHMRRQNNSIIHNLVKYVRHVGGLSVQMEDGGCSFTPTFYNFTQL